MYTRKAASPKVGRLYRELEGFFREMECFFLKKQLGVYMWTCLKTFLEFCLGFPEFHLLLFQSLVL